MLAYLRLHTLFRACKSYGVYVAFQIEIVSFDTNERESLNHIPG